jgi:transcriptional regulator with GAF, ATPase, and Fis domain
LALAASIAVISAPGVRAFVELDERLVSAQPGVLIARAPLDVHGPVRAHASRRLRARGFLTVDAAMRVGAPLFREVATYLGLGALPVDPAECAEMLASAAVAQRAAIVVSMPPAGTWDRAVATELARNARTAIVFVTADAPPAWDAMTFDLSAELSVADKLRWLSAIAEEAQTDLPGDLRSLEAWWAKARRVVPDGAFAVEDLGADARQLLGALALAGRSLPASVLPRLGGTQASLDELAAAGLVSLSGGLVAAACSLPEIEAAPAVRVAVAECLQGGGLHPDPWAFARAAELLLSAGELDAADAAMTKALEEGIDSLAASELVKRWYELVTPITGEAGLALREKAAHRALALGDAVGAQRWCEGAAAIHPNDPAISLLMARALLQLGDLVSAGVCLGKAETNARPDDNEMLARIATERAEAAYLAAELDNASAHASRAASIAVTAGTRLAARGTLGKILLARGAWDLAEAHCAEDAIVAASAGEVTAELRARLNRGIALLSKGRLDDARTLLEGVLEDGARLKQDRARAYALSNLGLVAYRQHDYGAALDFWERTIRLPQALRGRLSTALTIANLADLRLRLGLVDHAEHALVFGRRLFTGSVPLRCSALFKWVSAQVALARRNTELSRREIEASLADAQASGDRYYIECAWLVSARIALEDGDLGRAMTSLDQAELIARSPRALAEIAVLRASYLRASGGSALDVANSALELARSCGDEDLLSELHMLLALLHRDASDLQAALAHCSRAIAVRDQVASGLPADIRAAFLAKAENIALSRLHTSLAHDTDEEESPRTARSSSILPVVPPHESGREIVGDDPQMKSLSLAIRKVARSQGTVLIRGESGTGKELVADALHRASERASGPLVTVNCAALVETLLLSELFGHEKGAFTGASARRRGRFEMAEGGTLFLDEIGDISPRTQVALLRVLQEKTFERVGGTQPIRANVRVVCATHRDLRAMVERGEFREDLYYRLRGITLEVPSLRARLGDLPKIAEHLLGRIAAERGESQKALASDALDLLMRHRWPGNVRELENVLRAASLFAESDLITAADVIDNVDDLRTVAQSGPPSQPPVALRTIPPPPLSPVSSVSAVDGDDDEDGFLPEGEANATSVAYAQVRQGAVSLSDIKRQIERDCIARALAETKGNITRAATLLGMKRPRLSQLVKQYGLSGASSEGNQ